MQWHPIFAHLLRPLVESHFEVRTDQSVGDLPRQSDVVLLRKTSTGPTPFQGLWRRLTTWNVLEYKGPTVSPRFDELHDLLELGLGIHRRLNELQRKEQLPEADYPEVSFWYLVNHLGRRFLGELPTSLPGAGQVGEGLWEGRVYGHPVLLVSVRELPLERDSIALHVLAGVPDEQKHTIADVLKAEPALWPNYGAWLILNEPAIWQEISLMAAQPQRPLDFGPLVEYLKKTDGLKRLIEAVGVKEVMDALKPEQMWEALSAERREELLQLARQGNPPRNDPT
jgi:hypothetical protein